MQQGKARGRIARAAITAALTGAMALGGVMAPVATALADSATTVTLTNEGAIKYTSYVMVFSAGSVDVTANAAGAKAAGVDWAGDDATAQAATKAAVLGFLANTGDYAVSKTYVDWLKENKLISEAADITGADKDAYESASNAATYIGIEIAKANAAGSSYDTKTTDPNVPHMTDDGSFAQGLAAAVEGLENGKAGTIDSGAVSLSESGYYVLAGSDDVTPMWLPLNANGTAVTLYAKDEASQPTLQKEAAETQGDQTKKFIDAGNGEEVYFTLTGTLPKGATYTDLKFEDTLPAGLTVSKDDVTVTRQEGTGAATELASTAYVVSDIVNGTFTVTINTNGADATGSDVTYVVSYKATVTSDAGQGAEGANTNKATFSFKKNGENDKVSTESEASVITYAIHLDKQDDANKFLNGAKFTIQDVDNTSNTYLQYLQADGKMGADAYEFTTGDGSSTGTFDVKAIDASTYRITETEAPSGYSLIGYFDLTIEPEFDAVDNSLSKLGATLSEDATAVEVDADAATGVVTLAVTDPTEEIRLPITGMTPSQLGTVAGLLLVAAGAAMALRRRQAERA